MPYIDFPEGLENQKKRKAFWLSEEGLALILGWRRNGVTIKDIATKNIGVSMSTFWGWYRQSDGLKKACATGRDIANCMVEDALFRRAVGYDYTEQTRELIDGELIVTKEFTRHMPPDVKAIAHWLFNKKPEVWRAVQESAETTQYMETIRSILVAMKEVAQTGEQKVIETKNAD